MTSGTQPIAVDVSIVIVTFDSQQDLRICLEAAIAQQGVTTEIVVVDGAHVVTLRGALGHDRAARRDEHRVVHVTEAQLRVLAQRAQRARQVAAASHGPLRHLLEHLRQPTLRRRDGLRGAA